MKQITLSRRGGFVRFRYSRRGTKWPGVGECPVPFVFATCLKTSPSCCSRLLLFPCACVFTKRKRTRVMRAVESEGGEDARSFDSTAFLRIRQTFDSFTWEPRNSSWWLATSLSLPFSTSLPHLISWSAFGCQVHVSWPSMPLDMSPAESRFCVFLTSPTSHVWPRYPSSWIPR